MEQLKKPNELYLRILGKPKCGNGNFRLITFCVCEEVDDGVLVFNSLTREVLLLTKDEYSCITDLEYLRNNWFVVPFELDDYQIAKTLRWVIETNETHSDDITLFTIFTTTDCNARCFYCFELGRQRMHMSRETAYKTVEYIKAHCGGKTVRLRWFGGEPLYNAEVIDIICKELRDSGIQFTSRMPTNGFLFDEELIQKAKNEWNLKSVQITLDGREEAYNRTKAYIYKNVNAYQRVLSNIDSLLANKIFVYIRMNIDFHNINELHALTDELAVRYGGNPYVCAYVRIILDEKQSWDSRYSEEQWAELFAERTRFQNRFAEAGLNSPAWDTIRNNIGVHACMSDDPNSIVIMPDGELGVCEHFSNAGLLGHLDHDKVKCGVREEWSRRYEPIDECRNCFRFPECIRLIHCPYVMPCSAAERADMLNHSKIAMRNEYILWQKKKMINA